MATAKTKTTDETQLRAVVDDWANALRTKDADAAVSHYAADNVMFLMAPPLQFTPEDAPGKRGVEEWFATWDGPLGYEMRDLKFTVGAEVAFCHSLNRMTGKKTDGERVDMWFRKTLGFCKIGGEWKITHDHESVPFYMDGSYKAAVDLKP